MLVEAATAELDSELTSEEIALEATGVGAWVTLETPDLIEDSTDAAEEGRLVADADMTESMPEETLADARRALSRMTPSERRMLAVPLGIILTSERWTRLL